MSESPLIKAGVLCGVLDVASMKLARLERGDGGAARRRRIRDRKRMRAPFVYVAPTPTKATPGTRPRSHKGRAA